MSSEDEAKMHKEEIPDELPILPVRNTVLFPGVVLPITVGRDKSINLIKDAYKGDKIIGVFAQNDQDVEEPTINHLFEVGTVARILKMLKMPDGSSTVIIQGTRRVKAQEYLQVEQYFKAKVEAYANDDIKVKTLGSAVPSYWNRCCCAVVLHLGEFAPPLRPEENVET